METEVKGHYAHRKGKRVWIEPHKMRVSKKTGVKWVWFGGHGIHGYIGGREVAFFNTGDFSKDELTPKEAEKALKEIAKASQKEQAEYAATPKDAELILKRLRA